MGASSGDPDPAPRPGADPVTPAIDVVVLDEQDDVVVDVDRWAALATAALEAEGMRGTEVTVTFVDEPTIAELKRDHFGEHRPTDVLSFPLDEPALAGAEVADGAPHLLGDVVICPSVAVRQAPAHAGSVDDELALLLVHGLLHLLGHDHAEADERRAMQARERVLLASFHGPLGRDPWAAGPAGEADDAVATGAGSPPEVS